MVDELFVENSSETKSLSVDNGAPFVWALLSTLLIQKYDHKLNENHKQKSKIESSETIEIKWNRTIKSKLNILFAQSIESITKYLLNDVLERWKYTNRS